MKKKFIKEVQALLDNGAEYVGRVGDNLYFVSKKQTWMYDFVSDSPIDELNKTGIYLQSRIKNTRLGSR